MMKWILAILLFVSGTAIGQIGLRDDSTKYIRYQNQYGSRLPRFWADSAQHIPYFDTSIVKPQKPGAIMMHLDKNVYKWNGFGWESIGGGSGSSASLSNVGSGYRLVKTADGQIKTIFVGHGLDADSTTNTDAITIKTDTSELVTPFDLLTAIADVTITDKFIAYVDSSGDNGTGQTNNPAKKFRTLNGALDGTVGLASCVIQIGTGAFDSPDSAKMRSNIWFRGSGMPAANDSVTVAAYYSNTIQAPTKLIGGTILRGSFIIPFNRENITMSDLGVDVGSDWVTNVNGGTAVDGMLCAQKFSAGGGLPSADGFHELQVNTKPRRNMQWRNIRVLMASPTSPFHAFLIENSINPMADNIYTQFGFAGVIIKTIGGIYTNLHTRSHGTYHIIAKSNDYSHCYGIIINGFECSTSGMGVTLDQGDAGSPGIYWSSISNGFINLTSGAMSLTGDNMNISNVNIVQGGAIVSTGLIRSSVSNVINRLSSGRGFDINTGSVLANGAVTWSNCSAIGSVNDGFYVQGGSARNDFESITSGENTGYGFNSNGTAYIGSHNYYSNTAGVTTGTINVRNNDVAEGRTGITSTTAYAVLAGGTTSTGALQQVSGLGTSGYRLTSNGAGALPTWQPDAGGVSGSGTSGRVAYWNGASSLTSNANFLFNGSVFSTGTTNTQGQLNVGGSKDLSSSGAQSYYAAATYTDQTTAASGTASAFSINYFAPPTIAAANASVTFPFIANLMVDAPTAGTNATITDKWAIMTGTAGSARIQGTLHSDGALNANSSFRINIANITTNTTLSTDVQVVRINAAGGNVTITLPAASAGFNSTLSTGINYIFKRIDSSGNTVTIQRAGSDTIDGATSFTLTTQYEAKNLVASSTTTWDIH